MHRYLSALCALVCLVLTTSQASASLSDYTFLVSSGNAEDMSSSSTLWSGTSGSRDDNSVNNVSAGIDLPFAFRFDGVSYDRISVSTNGLVGFGLTDVSTSSSNALSGSESYPILAPWWDRLVITGGAQRNCGATVKVHWTVTGRAPNRVVVVEWKNLEVADRSAAFSTWQVRLYEGTNAIEFYYDRMTSESCVGRGTYSTSATIGIASSTGDFMSVTPDFGGAILDRSIDNNSIDLSLAEHAIAPGTIYRFAPCNINLRGNPDQGGTAEMLDGDALLSTVEVQRGASGSYLPFSIDNMMEGCGTRNFRLAISGEHAAEYSLDFTEGTIGAGEMVIPTITFSPGGNGARTAVLTVTDDNSFSRSFPLMAIGTPRLQWIADLTEGGTPRLADGDTLLAGIIVRRRTSRDFQPMTIQNVNDNPSAPAALISLELDSAGGVSTQYEIVGPTTAELLAGESFTPVIRFTGEGVGPQTATLRVTADEETRVYTLRAISGAPAIEVRANGAIVDAENPAMNLLTSCVGEVVSTVPFVITNTGTDPLTIASIVAYLTDTTYQQGTPMLPLVRDAQGRPVAIPDYVISETPGGAAVELPLSVDGGRARQLYLSFAGSQPGKRFGRLFVATNAENIYGTDTDGEEVLGLFTTDLTARAIGSQLAANPNGLRIRPLVFPHTRVGDSAVMSFAVANAGACDLRINRAKLRISSGDVNEFRILGAMRASRVDAATGDYVLAPGAVDTITVRFTPSRAGTRLATVRIQTNDSTLVHPGIAERGALYVDLHGRGLAGLDGSDVVLAPVVIGGSVTGNAVLENTLTVAVGIDRIYFDGGEAAEFTPENWPTTPSSVLPGTKLTLGIRLTPTGSAGVRRTVLTIVTTTGDTVRVPVRGEAGTQTLLVSPTSLFENITLAVGQVRRQTLMISNAGTLPVKLTSVALTGVDSASYRIGVLPRFDLEPGQTEYLEVTFAPTTQGQTTAQIEVTAAGGQTHVVMLGGNAFRAHRDPVDANPTTVAPGEHLEPVRRGHDDDTARPALR
jgi:hypothetical protein